MEFEFQYHGCLVLNTPGYKVGETIEGPEESLNIGREGAKFTGSKISIQTKYILDLEMFLTVQLKKS